MSASPLWFEPVLGNGVAALAILCLYRVCIELARKNGD